MATRRTNDQPFAIGEHLQRRRRIDVQQIKNRLINDERQAISHSGQGFDHPQNKSSRLEVRKDHTRAGAQGEKTGSSRWNLLKSSTDTATHTHVNRRKMHLFQRDPLMNAQFLQRFFQSCPRFGRLCVEHLVHIRIFFVLVDAGLRITLESLQARYQGSEVVRTFTADR